jgi:hypothetical protein
MFNFLRFYTLYIFLSFHNYCQLNGIETSISVFILTYFAKTYHKSCGSGNTTASGICLGSNEIAQVSNGCTGSSKLRLYLYQRGKLKSQTRFPS